MPFAGKQTSSGRDRHEEEDGICTCFKIVKDPVKSTSISSAWEIQEYRQLLKTSLWCFRLDCQCESFKRKPFAGRERSVSAEAKLKPR
jgi:hypothetical protein